MFLWRGWTRRPGLKRATFAVALGLAAFVAAVAVLAAAAVRADAAPASVRAWLGEWQTNQGAVVFDTIGTCVSVPPSAATGNVDLSNCAIAGMWHRPGVGWVAIHGHVDIGEKYRGEVFLGCYQQTRPQPGDFDPCGALMIERSGNKFVGGYWKPCSADAFTPQCDRPHHPWLGHKQTSGCRRPRAVRAQAGASAASCGGQVRFHFRIDGFPRSDEKRLPQDLVSVEANTVNTKVLHTEAGEVGMGEVKMTTSYLEPGFGNVEKQITFNLDGLAAEADIGPHRFVRVDAKVVASTDPHCASGNTVEFRLTVDKTGAILFLGAAPATEKPCLFSRRSEELVWQDSRSTPVSDRHLKSAKIGKWQPLG